MSPSHSVLSTPKRGCIHVYRHDSFLLFSSILFLKSGLQYQAWFLSGGAGLKSNQRTEDYTHHRSITVTQVATSCLAAGFTDSQLCRAIDWHLLPCPQPSARHLLGPRRRACRRGASLPLQLAFSVLGIQGNVVSLTILSYHLVLADNQENDKRLYFLGNLWPTIHKEVSHPWHEFLF